MQTQKEIIADIKREMDLQEIQFKQLANDLNMSQQNLSKIFVNGNPTLSSLLRICNCLNLRIIICKDDDK